MTAISRDKYIQQLSVDTFHKFSDILDHYKRHIFVTKEMYSIRMFTSKGFLKALKIYGKLYLNITHR